MGSQTHLADPIATRFSASLGLCVVTKLFTGCLIAWTLSQQPSACGLVALCLNVVDLALRCWLEFGFGFSNRVRLWERWLTLWPCLAAPVLLLLKPVHGGSGRTPSSGTSIGALLAMFLVLSLFLSQLLARHQHLPLGARMLSAIGNAAVTHVLFEGTIELSQAERVLVLTVPLALAEAVGSALLHVESTFVSTSIGTALEPANAAIRLATYQAGELAPTIPWSCVNLIEPIGSGVFGTVFKAEYAASKVAAKLIHNGKARCAPSMCPFLLPCAHRSSSLDCFLRT